MSSVGGENASKFIADQTVSPPFSFLESFSLPPSPSDKPEISSWTSERRLTPTLSPFSFFLSFRRHFRISLLLMSARPPQSLLPSYQYATRKIAELKHLFPNVDDYRPTGRSQEYHLLIFKCCQTIVARSNELATLFKSIVVGLDGQVKLYDWEREFLFRLEISGSIGWSYLCEPNFNIIVRELTRCLEKRRKLVRCSSAALTSISLAAS